MVLFGNERYLAQTNVQVESEEVLRILPIATVSIHIRFDLMKPISKRDTTKRRIVDVNDHGNVTWRKGNI